MAKDRKKVPAKSKAQSSVPAERGWAPFWNLREEIDELFDDFYSGGPMAPFRRRASRRPMGASAMSAVLPTLDVIENKDEIKLTAELPGMQESDINIEVAEHMLTLSGEKHEEHEEGGEDSDYHLSERRFGSFRRSIQLPDGVDHDKIKAVFKRGVLTVHLPKTAAAKTQTRKIEVKAEH